MGVGMGVALQCRLEGLGATARGARNAVSGAFDVRVDEEANQPPLRYTLRMRESAPSGPSTCEGEGAEGFALVGDAASAVLVSRTSYSLASFATTALVLSPQQPGAAPFQLCNSTPYELRFRQRLRGAAESQQRWERLRPFVSVEYAWDEPLARPRLLDVSTALGGDGQPASAEPRSGLLQLASSALFPSRALGAPACASYALDSPGAVAHALALGASGHSIVAELRSIGVARCLHLTVSTQGPWSMSRRLLGSDGGAAFSESGRRHLSRDALRQLLASPIRTLSTAARVQRQPLWAALVSVSSVEARVLASLSPAASARAERADLRGPGGGRALAEIVSLVANGLTLSWTVCEGGAEDVEVSVRHAQVDCELAPCTHPVILRRSRAGPDPLLHVRARLRRPAAATGSIGFARAPLVIEEAVVRAQQLELCLEMHVLSALGHLFDSSAAAAEGFVDRGEAWGEESVAAGGHAAVGGRGGPPPGQRALNALALPHLLAELERVRRSGAIDGALYIESLTIHSLRLNLTVQLDLGPRGGDALDAPVRRLLIKAFGKAGVSQQRAPLRLPAFRLVNTLQRPQATAAALARHFGRGLSEELIYKLASTVLVRQALSALSRHAYILPAPNLEAEPAKRWRRPRADDPGPVHVTLDPPPA
ncbi:hypothetical protein T492DRAFT_1004996 [Pavlovales sp. CCMP2436]|nr:hypothetical protein T492DRAFT_1004996 [Pavlovales sp. CCMP2436]